MSMERSSQAHWIPLADLMTGLMLIFLLITAAFMLRVEQTTTLVVKEYEETKQELVRALQVEFDKNLKQWDAEFLGSMTLRFKNPDVLFATGSAELKPKFKAILNEFIPRYTKILSSEKFKNSIQEIRIEGHTSTFWSGKKAGGQDAYISNMALSQARTRSVLEHVLKIDGIQESEAWLREKLTANGLSSSKPIMTGSGVVDELASQRVEFRIVTNAEARIESMAREFSRK